MEFDYKSLVEAAAQHDEERNQAFKDFLSQLRGRQNQKTEISKLLLKGFEQENETKRQEQIDKAFDEANAEREAKRKEYENTQDLKEIIKTLFNQMD